MKIERETLTRELFAEVLPLARKCWHETTLSKAENCAYYGEREFDIDPDFERYQQFDSAGVLILLTMREEGALVGYLVGQLYRSFHHKHALCGHGDSIYVAPEYRSYTAVLAERFEREMREAGVQIIGWPTNAGSPVYEFLKARGYVGDEVIMEKRLCAS